MPKKHGSATNMVLVGFQGRGVTNRKEKKIERKNMNELAIRRGKVNRRAASGTSDGAKAVVRRNTEEVQSRGKFEVFEELFADDFVDHTPQPNTTPDKAGKLARFLRKVAFPRLDMAVAELTHRERKGLFYENENFTHNKFNEPLACTWWQLGLRLPPCLRISYRFGDNRGHNDTNFDPDPNGEAAI